jgi:phosphatidylglycerophosphate synthase
VGGVIAYMFKGMTVANLTTGSRVVFFVLFVWAAHIGAIEWMVVSFILAWGLDAVDGWVARRLNQTTGFGYIFDKVVDRVVLFCGLLVLLVNRLVPDYLLLVLVKDIASLPAASVQIHSNRAMPSTGRLGKVASAAQGVAVMWALFGAPYSFFVVLLVAVLGGVVGGFYVYGVYHKDKLR